MRITLPTFRLMGAMLCLAAALFVLAFSAILLALAAIDPLPGLPRHFLLLPPAGIAAATLAWYGFAADERRERQREPGRQNIRRR